jgi:beta-galactosidase
MGTFPAAAYFRKPNAATRAAFQALLPRKQRVTVSNPAIVARLHQGDGGTSLWVINPTAQPQDVSVAVDGGPWVAAKDLWESAAAQVSGGTVRVRVPARDAAVIELSSRQ